MNGAIPSPGFRHIAVLPGLDLRADTYGALRALSAAPLAEPGTWPGARLPESVDAVIGGWHHDLGATELAALPALRYIGLRSTSSRRVDHAAARARGITVTTIDRYADNATAEFVLAAMLTHLQRDTGAGLAGELRGRTLGLIGLGHVGRRVATAASGLGMTVRYHHSRGPVADPGPCAYACADELLGGSDVVSIHTPAGRAVVDGAGLRTAAAADTLLVVTTIGVPFPFAEFAAVWPTGRAHAVFDLVAAAGRRPELEALPRCRVIARYAGRTREAVAAGDRQLLDAVRGHLRTAAVQPRSGDLRTEVLEHP
ncbi:hypothetical protein Cs7R123_02950 [Catellatospora sp. TT07R-123]|uniref:NAD(P)-dependent oxidoreductase n=1 Tax=Catellatospora sp. TT07R-123 TaxID=2733863 RepID=UPI001B10A884|nr:NAD(P)-dependent oxidoreductase [Catellatospora sp. TT07R-123]GHJ42953.1 hypothetical protein Cs7R123_02950 [Catellatospora sp. TT07R-123]